MNRQDRISRLVARKLQPAAGKPLCFANRPLCICIASATGAPRQQTSSAKVKT
jgi:hypothetical protein